MTKQTSLSLTNFERNAIGFNNLFDVLTRTYREPNSGFPPYDIIRVSDSQWELTLAVAGFSRDDITIEVDQGLLRVSGSSSRTIDDSSKIVYRGIGGRRFFREWSLADYVEVRSATMTDGLLTIVLDRRLPEELQPKTIEIQ